MADDPSKPTLPVLYGNDEEIAETSSLDWDPSGASPGEVRQTPCLIVVKGRASLGMIFRVRGEAVIGRVVGVDLLLAEEGVSRRHAKVTVEPGGTVRVVDLGSSNGLRYRGVRVREQILTDGDKIQVGDALLAMLLMDDVDETLQKNLYESATHDRSTHLYNRRYFVDVLNLEFTNCLRYKVPLSLVRFDVDQYNHLTDAHGRAAGEFVLRRIALIVNEVISSENVVIARWREDQLALLLPEHAGEDAATSAEWIRAAAESTVFTYCGARLAVTLSVGVARCTGRNYSNPDQLIDAAEQCLYRAKARRNCVEVAAE